MPRAGAVWVDVLPNMSGFQPTLQQQLGAPVRQASQTAGEESGRGFGERFKSGLAAIGVAKAAEMIGGKVSEAFTEALDQGSITKKLQAQLGATSAQGAKYGKIAGQLYAKGISGSFEDAAEAIRTVAQSGLLPPDATNKQLQSIATKASDVANTFGQDFESVTNAASRLVSTGLVKTSDQAFDLITKGFQTLGPKADDLLDTFNEYSTQFATMGISAQTALGIMTQAVKGGARDTDNVADALKEFSLRAVDGSTTTASAFKKLGINATDFVTQFTKGGASSQKALDQVFDKLRTLKGADWRNTVSNLFGGPGEDLGKSINSIDVSKATKEVGDLGGTAAQVGKTLRSGPTYQIGVFKRTAEQGLTNFIGGKVIPVVTQFGQALGKTVVPALQQAEPPARRMFDALTGSPGRMQATAIALTAIAGGATAIKVATAAASGVKSLAGGIVATAKGAKTAATNIRFAAFAVRYYTVTGTQSAVQAVKTGAAWVASSSRSAAGWVAARARAAASFVQTAASATANAARTAVTWTVAAIRSGAGWAAARARAVGSFVATAASATASAATTAAAWVGAQARSLVATVRSTAVMVAQRAALTATAIASRAMAAAQWLVNAAMDANPLTLVIVGLVALGAALVVAYNKSATFRAIVQGAWSGIKATAAAVVGWFTGSFLPFFTKTIPGAFSATVNWVKAHWPLILSIITGPIGAATIYVVRHWDQISSGISGAWSSIRAHTLTPLGNFFTKTIPGWATSLRDKVVGAFSSAASGIGRHWQSIESLTKKPVNWVVNTVWNHGIVSLWKKITGWIPGVPKLGTLPQLATGGPVRGPGTGTSDSVPALLSNNEHVWTAAEVAAAGGHGAVAALRSAVLGGRPVRAASAGARFKDGGGVLGALKSVGGKIVGGVKDAAGFIAHPSRAFDALLAPLMGKLPGLGQTAWAKAVAGLPRMAVAGLKAAAVKAATAVPAPGSGPGVQKWAPLVRRALAELRLAPGLLGKVLSQMQTESGGNPKAINLWDINAKNGVPSKGLMQVIDPTFNAYAGKYRSRGIYDPYANIYSSLNYAEHTYGKNLSALGHGHGYATGTPSAVPGTAWVGEREPELVDFRGRERVYTPRQLSKLSAPLARPSAPASATSAEDLAAALDGVALGLVLDDGTTLTAHMDARVAAGLTAVRRRAKAGSRR
ncbi:phage tail tape measure protein [Streptomyces tremellae]|uniref:Transglycosylase SLT domain-containing protein n=1 Tax=Streptomyces tremellae TaxID=1124239 RepID=A0ABP7EZK8_9ACTN